MSLRTYIQIVMVIAIVITPITCDVNVEFRLFANQDPVHYTSINSTHFSNFVYDPTLQYIILCHGWRTGDVVSWYNSTIYSFMTMPKYVVIGAYYQDAVSSPLYAPAVANVPVIGQIIGDFIVALKCNKSVPLEQIEIVGHSLGAHISGDAGNRVSSLLEDKVKRIFGLDPAAPGYFVIQRALQKTDARSVIVFHTSAVGLQDTIGDLDFYPNGGLDQGWCGMLHSSSHTVATFYFYCSVDRSCVNWGTMCDYYVDLNTVCKDNDQALMGYWVSDNAKNGTYYLTVTC